MLRKPIKTYKHKNNHEHNNTRWEHKAKTSHARTVVRECCKGDDESQWEMGKFDPPPPKNPFPMVTKICVGNYVGDIYHRAKLYPNRCRGFGSAHVWFRTPRHKVTRLFFGSWERLQPRRAHRFWRKIRQTTWFRARKCLLGVAKPKSKASTPIFSKTRHFWAQFLTWNFFAGKRLQHWTARE